MRGTDQIIVVDQHGLNAAVVSVIAEGHPVNPYIAEEAVERVYAMRDGHTGAEFRALFDKAIKGCKIPDAEKRGYELALGRYFNPRAVAAVRRDPEKRKGPWIPQVLEADVNHVLLKVYPEVNIEFTPYPTCRNKLTLEWNDIRAFKDILSGSSYVAPVAFRRAKQQALAILNSKRLPAAEKV